MTDLHADTVRRVSAYAGQPEIRQRFLELLRDPTATRSDRPAAHITASALIVSADLSRVLLCLHGRMHRWVQLGGHCEAQDDTVLAAALREAYEESGIEGIRMHPVPIDLDIHPVHCRYGKAEHFDVRFAGIAPPDAVPVVSSESADLAWCDPAALPEPLATATDRLVAPALRAAADLRG